MKELISKAVSLGLGLGVTGRDKAQELARDAQKQLGLSRTESAKFVSDMIRKGEVVRKNLEKQVDGIVKDAVDRLIPVSRKEFSDFKAAAAKGKKRARAK
jgi:polyhydroxyalkanoate synthesis regulator phasin